MTNPENTWYPGQGFDRMLNAIESGGLPDEIAQLKAENARLASWNRSLASAVSFYGTEGHWLETDGKQHFGIYSPFDRENGCWDYGRRAREAEQSPAARVALAEKAVIDSIKPWVKSPTPQSASTLLNNLYELWGNLEAAREEAK